MKISSGTLTFFFAAILGSIAVSTVWPSASWVTLAIVAVLSGVTGEVLFYVIENQREKL